MSDRVAVVTGASGGIGRATVRALAARGYRVALLARGEDGLEAAAAEVRDLGDRALAIPVDVADAQAVDKAAEQIEQRLGPIDVWINNAFSSVFATFDHITPAEFDRITQVSYLGCVNGTRTALARMRPRHRGVVVQVSSALAYRGIPLQTAYCGAKHAIQGFTEALRCELMHDRSHIQVTMVVMPAVNTPQFTWVKNRLPRKPQPVPPIYQPEVAAQAVVYAAEHPRRREYWVGGSTVLTLLANKVAAGALDRYLARTGYQAQYRDQPAGPTDGGNLWQPADSRNEGDYGAHGAFDERAHSRSAQLWASQHRTALTAASAVAAAGALAWWHRRR
jgi:NAD(P)-dependent dehydrogenase (short-subunit alcohol dehydrogenase family)